MLPTFCVSLALTSTSVLLASDPAAGAHDLAGPPIVPGHRILNGELARFPSRDHRATSSSSHHGPAHPPVAAPRARERGTRYILTDIGSLDPRNDGYSAAGAVNNRGIVVGAAAVPPYDCGWFTCIDTHAARFDGRAIFDLGTLSVTGGSLALDINDADQVVGSSTETIGVEFGDTDAYLWQDGEMMALPDFGQRAFALALNDRGWIVGAAEDDAELLRPVAWRGGGVASLPLLPGGLEGYAIDVNEAGIIVGGSEDALEVTQPCAWRAGHIIVLDVLDRTAKWGEAEAISDRGDVVGATAVRDGSGAIWQRATLWRMGFAQDLGVLNGPMSRAYDVNNAGQIVGESDHIGGGRAFLWMDGEMHDLADRIAPNSGWTLDRARGINEAGQIVGEGYCPCGVLRGFVLTPVHRSE